MMIVNDTSRKGNSTIPSSSTSSPAGLAVGLTLFFLLLLIVAAVIIYKYSSKISSMVLSGQRKSQEEKQDCTDTRAPDSHHYISLIKEQPTAQNPIYENFNTLSSGSNRPAAKPHRQPTEPEEDLYLQYDGADCGIYNNDPAHDSMLPHSQEEDLYVVPDAL